ncbi:MAG: hypothetical protein ACTHJR_10905 [Sphingomonas sp.]|uniref:hypothetical protein n=1 Tax=Sphingomonas sp. TaxID=28214 RepID=UPI003F7F2288
MQIFLFIGLVVYVIVFPALCVFAWFRGGVTERRVATAYMIAAIASIFADLFGNHWRGPNWGVIIVDIVFLVVLIVIARQSTRFWPLWAAASQLAGCLAHFPAIMNPAFPKELYVSTQPYWAVPLLVSLMIGSISAHRQRRIWEKSDRATSGIGPRIPI